jgi:molybdenum cofactor synthesis domain-containing protein
MIATTFASVLHRGQRKVVWGLPGNPVSCFVSTQVLVLPSLRRWGGRSRLSSSPDSVSARVSHSLPLDADRPEYHRVSVRWDSGANEFIATSTGRQTSSRLLSCLDANGLLCLPRGETLEEGSKVATLLLSPPVFDVSHVLTISPTIPLDIPTTTPHNPPPIPPITPTTDTSTPLSVSVGLLTVSDRVSAGEALDRSGEAMQSFLSSLPSLHIDRVFLQTVPDEIKDIQRVITHWIDDLHLSLVITSGGTGLSPRDVTPEAVRTLLHREATGLSLAMTLEGLRHTPLAMLSRPVVGVRHQSLVVCLPGSPKAVREGLGALKETLVHALHLVGDISHGHHRPSSASASAKGTLVNTPGV